MIIMSPTEAMLGALPQPFSTDLLVIKTLLQVWKPRSEDNYLELLSKREQPHLMEEGPSWREVRGGAIVEGGKGRGHHGGR